MKNVNKDTNKEVNFKTKQKTKRKKHCDDYDEKLLTCFLIALINSPEDSAKVKRETERLYKEL